MLNGMTIKNSTELVSIGFGKDPVETKYTSWISIETRDNLIEKSQKEIESLLEEIDEFNIKTKINVEIKNG